MSLPRPNATHLAMLLLMVVQGCNSGGGQSASGTGGQGGSIGGTGGYVPPPPCTDNPPPPHNDPACPESLPRDPRGVPCMLGLTCVYLEYVDGLCVGPRLNALYVTCCQSEMGFDSTGACPVTVAPGQDPRCSDPAPSFFGCSTDGLCCDFQFPDAGVQSLVCRGTQWILASGCGQDAGASD